MSNIKTIQKYVHFHGAPSKGKILMIVSSPTTSKQTGWPIGFWAAELTHPMHVFQEAGYEVVVASTEGGKVEMDAFSDPTAENGYSAHDVISRGYLQQESFQQLLFTTQSLEQVELDEYAAIFLVGGQGPIYTFRGNKALEQLLAAFYGTGKPTAVVCHATAILLDAKTTDGQLLVNGKTWTGFANAEEDFADQAVGMKIQPYRIEEEAKKIETSNFVVSDPFSAHAIADGNLITGQQQNSGAAAAELVLEQL
ncbi:MAG: type 1 glutamine amidotransferase domain-containing protein [Bacteroidota bacterium]